jgi:hypothetical protein
MIKILVTMIREFITQGVTNPKLSINEWLILHHIVRCTKVQSNHVEETISLRRDRHYASPGLVEGERAIEIHAPVLLGDGGGGLLSLRPFGHEIHQGMGLDRHLGDVG